MHLRLDDVDGPGTAVLTVESVHRDQAGEQRVLNALGDFPAVGVDDGVVGHQMTDIADEQQTAAGQGEFRTVGGGVGTVIVEHPGEGVTALGHRLGQIAPVESEPVAVAEHLVIGVDGGHRILEVHDRGDRGLQHHILDAGRVGRSDGRHRVDLDLDMQSVVDQQHRRGCGRVAEISGELSRIGQSGDITVGKRDLEFTLGDHKSRDVRVLTRAQRNDIVEEPLRVGDHRVAAHPVVARARLRAALGADDVGAVEGVIERTPARVRGIERKARIENGHHQLRTGGRGDFGIHTRGRDGEVGRFSHQVSDIGQELPVLTGVDPADDARAVPLVDLGL